MTVALLLVAVIAIGYCLVGFFILLFSLWKDL